MVEAERRLGGPANEWAVRVWEWLFVVAGPGAVAFGAYALYLGYIKDGVVLIALGVWMTFLGYLRLWRWHQRRRSTPR